MWWSKQVVASIGVAGLFVISGCTTAGRQIEASAPGRLGFVDAPPTTVAPALAGFGAGDPGLPPVVTVDMEPPTSLGEVIVGTGPPILGPAPTIVRRQPPVPIAAAPPTPISSTTTTAEVAATTALSSSIVSTAPPESTTSTTVVSVVESSTSTSSVSTTSTAGVSSSTSEPTTTDVTTSSTATSEPPAG